MTLRERLRTIGQTLAGNTPLKEIEVIKEIKAEVKNYGGFFVDYFKDDGLSSSTRVSSKTLLANKGWVFRNNDVIAKEVASIEFELFSIRVVGQEIQFNPITTHPILDILDRFNEFTSASDGFYVTQSHKKLAGDAFWYIDGTGININGLYILPPDKIKIEIGKVAGAQKIIDGYHYEDTIEGKRIDEVYTPDEIIHFKQPNPKNYFRGLGAVEAAADDIDLDWMAIEANKMLFKRGLIGNFVLSTENSLTDEQRKQLRAELTASYTGLRNAFKIPILSGGLKPENIQMTNKDMEFIKQQEWVRDKIASIFGNSKAVLGITDDVNRANAEATIVNWKQTTIRSEMKQITDTLNEFLVPRFGTNLILGFKDLVEQDEGDLIDMAIKKKNAGIININEAREELGLEPIKGGDEYNFQREERLVEQMQIPKSLHHVKRTKIMRGAYKQVEEFKALKEITKPVAQKIIKKRKQKTGRSLDIKNYYDKQIQVVEVAEGIFQRRLEQFIDKLVRKAISEVPNEVRDMQSKQLFDEEDEIARAIIDFTPILETVAGAAGDNAMDLIKSSKPYIMTNIKNKIKARVELFAKSLVETDRDKLVDIITDGVREGLSVPDIRRNITTTFEDYTKMQAERITRTEVLSISNKAALDAWEQSGVVEGKEWLTAPGADEQCEQYDGKKVFDLGGNFYSPDSEFEDGDPPLHPNCRCVVLPILEGEPLDKSQLQTSGLKKIIRTLSQQIESMDRRTKEYKDKNSELEGYIKELEDFLDET